MSDTLPRAAIDVGSNTVRLLVARVEADGIERLFDQSEFVRLGLGVEKTGKLDEDRERAATTAIKELTKRARDMQAEPIIGIATSAVRDASNGREFVENVRREAGLEVRILSGDEEARLTYLGATLGRDSSRSTLVVDLGGGSGELILAEGGKIRWSVSRPLGSGRLTERFVHSDPPSQAEVSAVSSYVRSVLDALPPGKPELIVFTGGTATHVAWLAGYDGTSVGIDFRALQRALSVVTSESAHDIVERYGFRKERAQVLPAGVTTLYEIVQVYQPVEIVITQSGIREGALLDSVRSEH